MKTPMQTVRITQLIGRAETGYDRVEYHWPCSRTLSGNHQRHIDVVLYPNNGNVGDFVDMISIVLPSTWKDVVGVIAEYHAEQYGHCTPK